MSQQTIPEHYVEQFRGNVQHKLRTGGSLLRMWVTEPAEPYKGEQAEAVKQFGKSKARVGQQQRYEDTPINPVPRDKRVVYPNEVDWGEMPDKQDLIRELSDPTSALTESGVMSMGEALDEDIIIPSYFGVAKSGKGGAISNVFDSNMVVANDVGGASATGLNVAKLKRARKLLRAKKVKLERETIVCPITSTQEEELLNETEFISGDFRKSLILDEDGRLKKFIGINFVVIEELPKTGNDREIPFYVKSGIYLGRWNELEVNVGPDPGKKFQTRIYMHQAFGAVRTEEGKVAKILCTES